MLKFSTTPFPDITRNKNEKFFKNSATAEFEEFPSIDDEPSVELSVVIPAFDEEQRRKTFFTSKIIFFINFLNLF